MPGTYIIEYCTKKGTILEKVVFNQKLPWERAISAIVNKFDLIKKDIKNTGNNGDRVWTSPKIVMKAYKESRSSTHIALKEANNLFGGAL